MKLSILTLFIFTSLFAYGEKNLFKDPEFKDPKKSWHLSKRAEYKNITPSYKRGVFHIVTVSSSSGQYLSLLTPVDLEVGQTYEIRMDLSAKGEGAIALYYGAYGDEEKSKGKKRDKKKSEEKNEGLGLKESITDFTAEFKTYTYHFTVLERRRSGDRQSSVRINLGDYMGDFKIKNLSLTKSDQALEKPVERKK
ncbi:hypothetical protein PQO03_00485 [Lentisphaera profundi]|uniref:Uncharacterized protein n=1 Tax=Lentisphaera profundi TaxID=1658616 RepID=A0ABY7VQG7_9BACT|nr:hypothetical protein [Lentisphaera profundi]WDE96440.1 hypothetical protein PQO03_00485 [Lentisphaera profundi]